MNYDKILEELGEFGPWQLIPVILLWFPSIASGIFVLTYSFTGKIYQYLAKRESGYGNPVQQ
jgi:hypothetical protein